MNILVIGTGAIGSFYGGLLARAGHRVAVQARSDYDHVRAHGIAIRSETKLGDWHFAPASVVRSGAELPEPPDYVLLCVKTVPGADRIGMLRDAVGPATTIVLITNGVDVEAEIAEAFPNRTLISGLAFICVTRVRPGEIWHQTFGRLVLGLYPSGSHAAVTALVEAFAATGISCAVSADIVTARWQKCVWNAPFNPMSVLSGGLSPGDILRGEEGLVRALMQEVVAIAGALGHLLPADIVAVNVESTLKMPPYKTSMLLDFEAGLPLETEAILGNAVRAAHRAGVAAPHLETLYALLRLREASAHGD